MLFYRQSDVMNGAGMKELERIGLNEDELSRMAVNWPHLLSSHNVARVVEFLVTRLQLNEGELRKMVLTIPSLITSSSDTLESKMAFFDGAPATRRDTASKDGADNAAIAYQASKIWNRRLRF